MDRKVEEKKILRAKVRVEVGFMEKVG